MHQLPIFRVALLELINTIQMEKKIYVKRTILKVVGGRRSLYVTRFVMTGSVYV